MSLLTLLCILTLSVCANARSYLTPELSIKFAGPKVWKLVISADRIGDKKFAYSRIERKGQQPSKLQVNVNVLSRNYGTEGNLCLLNLTERADSVEAAVDSFQRISRETVVLTWHDKVNSGNEEARLVILNMTNCSPIDHGMGQLPVKHIVLPYGQSGGFDIIVADETTCKEFGKVCRISYDRITNKFNNPQRFEANLQWNGLIVEPFDGNTLIARGFDAEDSYQMVLLNRTTGVPTKLMSLKNANPRVEVRSSGLTFCYIMYPDKVAVVHCVQLGRKGEQIFRKTIEYPEAVTLLAVENLGKGEIFLLAGKVNCQGDECWNVYRTQLSGDKPVDIKLKQLQCDGDRKQFAFFGVMHRIASDAALVEFTCESSNGLLHAVTIV